jgi:hypothetical protein
LEQQTDEPEQGCATKTGAEQVIHKAAVVGCPDVRDTTALARGQQAISRFRAPVARLKSKRFPHKGWRLEAILVISFIVSDRLLDTRRPLTGSSLPNAYSHSRRWQSAELSRLSQRDEQICAVVPGRKVSSPVMCCAHQAMNSASRSVFGTGVL